MNNQVRNIQKPNFFIIGAAKSGTSSLWGYLDEHPEIFMSKKKEPGYFAPEWPGRKIEERYLNLFNEADNSRHKRIGEASTMYLSCPGTAANIYQFAEENRIDDIKLIAMLRNPADRAYSLYNWQVQEGYEYAANFAKAMQLEEQRSAMPFPNSGLYSSQVEEYFDFFGRDRVMIIIFEEFIRDIPTHLFQIYDFLDLDLKDFQPDIKVYNPSYDVHASWLQFGLRKINQTIIEKKPVRWLIKTKEQRDRLLSWGLKNQKPPKLEQDIRRDLLSNYKGDINKLESLLHKDLSIWFD